MELKEFMQKFSPIGDEEFISEDGSKTRGFNIKNFPKALQNYTDVICELRRVSCSNAYLDYNGDDCCVDTVSDVIYDAKQPNMEEIING